MSLVLTDVQKVALSFVALDAAGNAAPVDGLPTWTVVGANPEIVSLVVSEDGLNCAVVTTGPLGTCQVQLEADARLGEEVVPITGVLDVEVIASEAVNLTVNAGIPESRL